MKPLVSIILIAYNAERFISRALASAASQTYENIETLVVDDGSTDRTADLVRSFADPRIRYFYQNNQGQGAARNHGIRESRGTYITFLDADDFYLPEKIERQVIFLETHPEYQVVYCNALHFYSERPERLFKLKGNCPSGDIFRNLLQAGIINPNTFMAHRRVFEDGLMFRTGRYGRYAEEWELYLRLARAGFKFGYIDEDLVVVEVREGSNTTWDAQYIMKENVVEMLEGLVAQMSEGEKALYEAEKALRQHKVKLAAAYLVNKDKRAFGRIMPNLTPMPLAWLLTSIVRFIPADLLRSTLIGAWKIRQRRWLYQPAQVQPFVLERIRELQTLCG